jgi:hypothetical protein
MAEAAKHIDKYLRNVNAAVQDGRLKRGLERGTLESWKDAAINKGVNRYVSAIAGSQGKMEKAMGVILSHQAAGKTELAKMKTMTPADMDARMLFQANHMRKLKGKVR